MKTAIKIAFIGAGNVATHLATALRKQGFCILQVYSRTKKSADILAKKVGAQPVNDLRCLSDEADIYLISLPDNILLTVLNRINKSHKLFVHTSGFHDMHLLKAVSERIGVFYPLQTFSKNRELNFSTVPICIEAGKKEDAKLLIEIAETISSDVRLINSDKRRIIHLAAVFACNFSNYMYSVADSILAQRKVSFDILHPLIMETAQKVLYEKPMNTQTGPAKRGDITVIKQHLSMLSDKDVKKIYKMISDQIMISKPTNKK